MSVEDKPLVKAQGGNLAPQHYNEKKQQFELQTGKYGSANFIERGSIIKDVIVGSTDVIRNYSTEMYGFAIVNTGDADLTFTIGNLTIPVGPGEPFEALFDPFMSVEINATDSFKAVVSE